MTRARPHCLREGRSDAQTPVRIILPRQPIKSETSSPRSRCERRPQSKGSRNHKARNRGGPVGRSPPKPNLLSLERGNTFFPLERIDPTSAFFLELAYEVNASPEVGSETRTVRTCVCPAKCEYAPWV